MQTLFKFQYLGQRRTKHLYLPDIPIRGDSIIFNYMEQDLRGEVLRRTFSYPPSYLSCTVILEIENLEEI
jgi:hypothetical protein